MRKLLTLLTIFAFLIPAIVFADSAKNDDSTGQMIREQYQNQEMEQERNQLRQQNSNQDDSAQNEDDLIIDESEVQRAKDFDELNRIIGEQKVEFQKELENINNKAKEKVFANQNQVREAVMGLLSAKDLVGGIGSQISTIAKEVNNSLQNTVQAEEKIQSRGKIAQFFFGGDKSAAQDLLDQAQSNETRVASLQNLVGQCTTCGQDLKDTLNNQIEKIQAEQTR
ncbi:MAG: hypothetical protein JW816_00645, partial [Candidatus Buchananbacteria bacterium]|nr:hypothetical protein [Candidatus Buchananbacteria bacterium]